MTTTSRKRAAACGGGAVHVQPFTEALILFARKDWRTVTRDDQKLPNGIY